MEQDDVGTWDCGLCTYKNPADKFKCEICDFRRGTSTRKPRCNTDTLVAQVLQQQEQLKQQTRAESSHSKPKKVPNQNNHDGPTTSVEKKPKIDKRSHDQTKSDLSGGESDNTEIGELEASAAEPPETECVNRLTFEGNYIKSSQPAVTGTTGIIIDKRRFKQLSVTVYDVTVTFTEYATRQNKYVRKKRRR